MPKDLKHHSAHKDEDVMRWLEKQIKPTKQRRRGIPAWIITAFEQAMERESDAVEVAPEGEESEDEVGTQDEVFKFELVYFKVEDTVFTVIKDWFIVEGSPFRDMFTLPTAVTSPAAKEGTMITNPIVLEQTSAASFRAFLHLLYGSRGMPLQNYDEWVGALELATRWNFEEIRKQAIVGLNSLLKSLGPAARIRLARQLSIGSWLRAGLIDLLTEVHRKKLTPTELTDAGRFSLDGTTVANVFFACLELRDGLMEIKRTSQGLEYNYCKRCIDPETSKMVMSWGPPVTPGPCHSCKIKKEIVYRIFGAEIEGCLYSEEY